MHVCFLINFTLSTELPAFGSILDWFQVKGVYEETVLAICSPGNTKIKPKENFEQFVSIHAII